MLPREADLTLQRKMKEEKMNQRKRAKEGAPFLETNGGGSLNITQPALKGTNTWVALGKSKVWDRLINK